jgi:hypothetical protein
MCPMCLCVSKKMTYLLFTRYLITNSANLEKKFILVLYFKHLVFLRIIFLTDIYDD